MGLTHDPRSISCYVTPGYGGEKTAIIYAAPLLSVDAPPDVVRKAWGHD